MLSDDSRIVGDFLALEHMRVVRRLLLVRCGLLVIAVAIVGGVIHGFTPLARWGSIALCASPVILAWIGEIRVARRLSRRLSKWKVIKSS